MISNTVVYVMNMKRIISYRDYIALNEMERIMSALGFESSPGTFEDTNPASAWGTKEIMNT
jgi:hypothetical protein